MSERSPLLDLPGAVAADAPDAAVAAHYGAIVGEQRRLLAGDTFVDLSHREVVEVAGPDRLTWLHAITTQHLTALPPGQPTDVLILSPQGRIEHGFSGIDDGEVFRVHTEPGAAGALIDFLDRMRFMSRVEVRDASADQAVIGLPGGGWQFVARADLADLPGRFGDPVGLWAWEALRIEAGYPRIGPDTDDRTIPNEIGVLERAVHLDKGCYRGQETVARVHTLGRPPRRLVRLLFDGSVDRLPAPGSDLLAPDGSRVGSLGTTARHHELGPIGLGLVKRSTAVDLVLTADGVPASQEVVVDPEVGLHVRARIGG